jgi:hypothetical protein
MESISFGYGWNRRHRGHDHWGEECQTRHAASFRGFLGVDTFLAVCKAI